MDVIGMVKQDARKLSRDALEQQRAEVVRLHSEGVRVMEIVRRTGLCWSTVDRAIKLWQAGGDQAIRPAARGRKEGSGRKLTAQLEAESRQLMRRRPTFHRLKHSLWSRDAVLRLIEAKFGITLTPRGIGNYLNRWGVVGGDPKKSPQQRCTREVQTWLNANYQQLWQRAKDEDAEIYWINKPVKLDATLWGKATAETDAGDNVPSDAFDDDQEAGFCLDDINADYVGHSSNRVTQEKTLIVSVENNQGKLLWVLAFGSVGATAQRKFLKAIIKDTRREKIFLIRNDMNTYESQALRDWLDSNEAAGIELFPNHNSIQSLSPTTPGV